MLVIGATIENFIYDTLNDSYVSASRFTGIGKDRAISMSDAKFYANPDTLKIQVGMVSYYKDFVHRFADRIMSSLNLASDLITRTDPTCVIHNTSEALFPPSETKDCYIRVGLQRYHTYKRISNFDIHFSELGMKPEVLCDILDNNLQELYLSQDPGFRKEIMGDFGKNIINRKFMYEGQWVSGFTYVPFSASIIKDKLFDFLHIINKSIDEYRKTTTY